MNDPHWMDLIAVIAATIGAYFLSTAGKGFQFQKGDSLEVIGAVFWGMHFVILGKYASRFEPITFASGHFFITGLLNFIMGLRFRELISTHSPSPNTCYPISGIPFHWYWVHTPSLGAKSYSTHRCCPHSWIGSCIRCYCSMAHTRTVFTSSASNGMRDHPCSSNVFPVKRTTNFLELKFSKFGYYPIPHI